MKLINVCLGPVALSDVDTVIPHSDSNDIIEISDAKAMRSKAIRYAKTQGMLLDVTKRLPPPEEITAARESYGRRLEAMRNTVSSSDLKKAFLSTDIRPMQPQGLLQDTSSKRETPALNEFKATGAPSAIWTGTATDAGGYSRMNKKFMFGLSDMGARISYDHSASLSDMDAETMKRLKSLSSTHVGSDAPKIYGMTAPMHYEWGRYKMLFTMMETRRLHPDYTYNCNCADEVIVPTEWCKNVFIESGVTKPIHVVPLGVDTSIYRPDVEPVGFSKNLKPFIFLSVFGWSLRKGYDVLLKAYLQEFTSDDPVTLLISSRYFGSTDEAKKKVIRGDIARISQWIQNPKKPHVVLFGDVLSDAMMPRLYAAASAYVLISRGEGFSLPIVEAGACRVPVITSRYSGHTDFVNDDNSYLVDVDGFRPVEKELAWISKYYENAEFPIFGDQAVEQTRYFMRRVFENQKEAKQKAAKLHAKVTKEYDWSVGIKKMYDKLCETYSRF